MAELMTALGLMSDDSLSGIDIALLRTDGENRVESGPALHVPYDRDIKICIHRAIKAAMEGRDGAADIGKAGGEVTLAHIVAVEKFLDREGLKRKDIDVIGFHGHTLLHRRPDGPGIVGRRWQIGDGRHLSDETRIDVVSEFERADMAAGGEGMPIAPAHHRALVASLEEKAECPVGVVTLGEFANLTYVPEGGRAIDLLAFDCGPGCGFIGEWVAYKTGETGADIDTTAAAGEVDEETLRMMLLAPCLRRPPPKFLDRYDFRIDAVKHLSLENGAATLTALMAGAIAQSEHFLPDLPGGYIICGEGRRNSSMMAALSERLVADVVTAEDAGWRGDDMAAECSAYLAVRSLKKLPLTYPKTTRVSVPTRGGVYYRAPV